MPTREASRIHLFQELNSVLVINYAYTFPSLLRRNLHMSCQL